MKIHHNRVDTPKNKGISRQCKRISKYESSEVISDEPGDLREIAQVSIDTHGDK